MSQFVRRLLVVLFLLSILLINATSPVSASPWQVKVDPWVLETAAEGQTEFLVFLTTQADLSAASALPTKLEKGAYVYQTLSTTAQRTQGPLLAELDRLGLEYRPYWIANMVWVRGDLNAVQALAQRLDVAHLYANPSVQLDAPRVSNSPEGAPEGIEWNITKVNAPQVWSLGYTGQGVVIGGQDTGYQWDHPALKDQYRGWSGSSADHNYNWHDAIHSGPGNECGYNSPFPCDDYGHGTHTMGTMVGDDGGSNQIGMAPGARWIGCRNMDNGAGTPATYAECYQWFVAPTRLDGTDPRPDLAPDVINNSWGCTTSEGCIDPNVLLTVVQNLVAAGIVTAHSAGNSGSGCSTVSEPAAIYAESFTVGATDSGDTIAGFSSRGPVTVDGSNRPKPDISAPGVGIRSSVPGGTYEGGWSGTSMAGPHVAGLIALLLSAHPILTGEVAQIESIIQQSAKHISWTGCSSSGVPNSAYGWGRIDALAAVQYFHQLELDKVASASSVMPGDYITYTLAVTNSYGIGPTTNVVLTDAVPTGTTFVSATAPYRRIGNTVSWSLSSLLAQGSAHVNLVVMVSNTASDMVANANYTARSDQAPVVNGDPVITQVERLDFLTLDKVALAALAFPGEFITYTLSVTNTSSSLATTHVVLTDTLPSNSTFVSTSLPYTLEGDTIRWELPSLAALEALSVDLVVQIDITASGSITNEHYAARSDQMVLVQGAPVNTPLGSVFFLPLVVRGP